METKELEVKSQDIVAQAALIVVSNQASYDMATDACKNLKAMMAAVADTFGPIAKKAHEAHKEVLAQQKKFMEPLELADAKLRMKSGAWFAEQERIRKAAEMEARRKAEDEALARAKEAQDSGNDNAAEREITEKLVVDFTDVPVASKNGVVYVTSYIANVVDMSKIPAEYMVPDMVKINAMVRATKGKILIPGIIIEEKQTMRI